LKRLKNLIKIIKRNQLEAGEVMKKTVITSIIVGIVSAIIGGLIVAGTIIYYKPLSSQKNVIKTVPRVKSVARNVGLTPEQIYDKFSPAVVNVSSLSVNTDFFGLRSSTKETATGSGFIISSDGLVVTNEHVVEGSDKVKVTFSDKSEAIAKVVGSDRSTDIAVLKVKIPKHIIPIHIAGSSDLNVGDTAYAIGNPLGLERSMSKGIISALGRTIDAPNGFQIRNALQTDAAINRGSSGGPLINIYGDVIGITSQIVTEGGTGNIGIAFAIPGNTVKKIVNDIKKNGKASHAWLGIAGRDIDKAFAKKHHLPITSGALIVEVFPDSPAAKSNLIGSNDKLGDIITSLGKKKITSMDDLVKAVETHRVGQKVKVVFYRGGKKTETLLKLEERPQKNLVKQ